MQIIQFFESLPCRDVQALALRYALAAEGERHALDRSGQLRRDLAAAPAPGRDLLPGTSVRLTVTDPVLAPARSAWQLPSTRARVIVASTRAQVRALAL